VSATHSSRGAKFDGRSMTPSLEQDECITAHAIQDGAKPGEVCHRAIGIISSEPGRSQPERVDRLLLQIPARSGRRECGLEFGRRTVDLPHLKEDGA
jgi:hypothetical protein